MATAPAPWSTIIFGNKNSRGVEIVDGGLAGLNLLPMLAGPERVIFVDAISGFDNDQQVMVLEQQRILADEAADSYGHAAGLPYLLRLLPQIHPGKVPEILMVGVQGRTTTNKIRKAAHLALQIADRDHQPKRGENEQP